jgi:PRTRC genetic system protein B
MIMTNISKQFSDLYEPHKALLIYHCKPNGESAGNSPVYVECYDIGKQGKPINAHPLSEKETIALAEMLQSSQESQNGFLRSKGLLPNNVLYVKPDNAGYAVWFTPPQQRDLFFVQNLGIKSGKAYVPAMVWKAGQDNLTVYAIKGKTKPVAKTQLCHAPYFNIHSGGGVCMGNANIQIDRNTCLENFMLQWERYFFGSYFSHTIAGGSKLKFNIVQLWQKQTETGCKFPDDVLENNGLTLSQIIR